MTCLPLITPISLTNTMGLNYETYFWNGSNAIPLQCFYLFIPYSSKLGRIIDNFPFSFLSKIKFSLVQLGLAGLTTVYFFVEDCVSKYKIEL